MDTPTAVGAVMTCAAWGNDRLAFVQATGTYGTDASTGQAQVPCCFGSTPRSSAGSLPHATRSRPDGSPPSLPRLARRLVPADAIRVLPPAAVLLAPDDGRYPGPLRGRRFGMFAWQPSPSTAVVAEIAEFAYGDDARLVLPPSAPPDGPHHIPAGALWTTGGDWLWRVWSVTQGGDVAFSQARSFVH